MPVAAKWPLWLCFAVLAVGLYPRLLGIGMIDTYRWGYNARYLYFWLCPGFADALLSGCAAVWVC